MKDLVLGMKFFFELGDFTLFGGGEVLGIVPTHISSMEKTPEGTAGGAVLTAMELARKAGWGEFGDWYKGILRFFARSI